MHYRVGLPFLSVKSRFFITFFIYDNMLFMFPLIADLLLNPLPENLRPDDILLSVRLSQTGHLNHISRFH